MTVKTAAVRGIRISFCVVMGVFALWNLSKFPCYFEFAPMSDVTYDAAKCEDPKAQKYMGLWNSSITKAAEENITFRPIGCAGMQTQWNLYMAFGRHSPLKLKSDVDNFLIPHTVMGVVIEVLLMLATLQGRKGLFDRSGFFFPLVAVFAIHILPEAQGIPDSLAGGAPINEVLCGLILLAVCVGVGGMYMQLGEDWSRPPKGSIANNVIMWSWIVIGLLINTAPLGELVMIATGFAPDNDLSVAFDRPHPLSGRGYYSKWNCPWIGRIAGLCLLFNTGMYGFEIYAHGRGEDWRSPFSRAGPALFQIAWEPAPGTGAEVLQRPETWLEATGECFVACILISWITTAIFNPGIFKMNILRNIVGYNNLCVGFDSAPARYLAMPMLVMQAVCASRYSYLDTIRLKGTRDQLSNAQYYFGYISNWVFAVHMTLFPMLLVILADYMSWQTTQIHLYLFMFTLFIMWMMIAGNVLEAEEVEMDAKIWFFMFTAHTFLLPVVGVIDVTAFWGQYSGSLVPDAPEHLRQALMHTKPTPPIPWYVTAYLDYGWFLLLLMTVLFLPKAPPVRVLYECSLDDEEMLSSNPDRSDGRSSSYDSEMSDLIGKRH